MSKYRAVKTTVGDITFDSKREAARYQELMLLLRAGAIRNLELQVPFKCVVNGRKICAYRADFIYFDGLDRIVEDVKGYRTREYVLKKKLVEALFNVKNHRGVLMNRRVA